MSARYSVILVPPATDPRKLLREGPAGFRPPMMWLLEPRFHGSVWVDTVQCAPDCVTPNCEHDRIMECRECGESWPCDNAGEISEPARWCSINWISGMYPKPPGEALVLGHQGGVLEVGIGIAKRSSTVHQHARRIVRDWMHLNFDRKLVIGERAVALVIDEIGHVVEREAAKGPVVVTVPVLAMRELARGT